MTYLPGDDAESLRAVLRDLLARHATEPDVRRAMESDSGIDDALWQRLASEIGVQGLVVPEELGGSGASLVELGVAFEELGRVLACVPFLSTVAMAGTLLLALGDEAAQQRHLPGICAGETVATVAGLGPGASTAELTATREGDGWRVSGTAGAVVDGVRADLVLVVADAGAGPRVLAVPRDAAGLTVTPHVSMDLTRRLAHLDLDRVEAVAVGEPGDVGPALRRTREVVALLLAAEQLGGAARVLEDVVAYAGTRIQFGRPIGSFQAVKHRCADLLVAVESARSAVHHGLWVAVHEPDQLAVSAPLAREVATRAFTQAANAGIQLHGGIGFTWEHSAHLYLKRAKGSELLFGTPREQRSLLADALCANAAGTRADGAAPVVERDALEQEVLDLADDFLRRHPVASTPDRDLRAARFDEGLAVLSFDDGAGGRGLEPALQGVLEQRFAEEGAAEWTERNVIGLGMAMPTLHRHGTSEQRARYLRPCFVGDEIWCQLFSEPGAGSDLAGLSTRAVLDGDHFVVDGQKVWTSLGHVADFGILLARTDPSVAKHKGLTYFVLDMRSPGVEVRPLRQLTGEAEFNEVYLTDVRIPVENVVGQVGRGWEVAMTTLANERVSLGARSQQRGEGPIAQAVAVYDAALAAGRADAAVRDRLMSLWSQAEAARLTNLRAAPRPGREPGPEGSIAKLQMAELNQAIYEFCLDESGIEGLLFDSYAETAPAATSVHGGADVRRAYLRSRANSIEGGTSEVLRNIVGERVLGLPKEPRP